jgi:ubiquinone/menaquinone biosynthesis C-methylase UbiE
MTVWDDEHWRAFFAAVARSETRRKNRREVYGADFPEEVDPNSFLTMTELRRMAQELKVGSGDTFIDIGCGRGGPGLWVARETGAALIGLDQVEVALEQAAQRAADFDVVDRARFQLGDIQSTGLEASSLDGAMSVDVLIFVDDKRAACALA